MPYVRKHGNQIAIVHGERDSTGTVQQRVLFSLYSKPEAEAALGLRQTDPPLSFQGLVESRHEGIRFDWKKLGAAIALLKDQLPEQYDYPRSGVSELLRAGLVAATKGLLAADPQTMDCAAEALRQHRQELLLVRQIIDDRLALIDKVRRRIVRHAAKRDYLCGSCGECRIIRERLRHIDGHADGSVSRDQCPAAVRADRQLYHLRVPTGASVVREDCCSTSCGDCYSISHCRLLMSVSL